MANNAKSVSNFAGGVGTFLGHWMRSFDTGDEEQDLAIQYEKELKVDVKMVLPGGKESVVKGG